MCKMEPNNSPFIHEEGHFTNTEIQKGFQNVAVKLFTVSYSFGIVWKHFSTANNDPWTNTPDMLCQRHDFRFLSRFQLVSRATDNNIRTHGGVLVCSLMVPLCFPLMLPWFLSLIFVLSGLMASALSSVLALRERLTDFGPDLEQLRARSRSVSVAVAALALGLGCCVVLGYSRVLYYGPVFLCYVLQEFKSSATVCD